MVTWAMASVSLTPSYRLNRPLFHPGDDRDIDAQMARTANRPVPSGRVAPGAALAYGIGLSALSWSPGSDQPEFQAVSALTRRRVPREVGSTMLRLHAPDALRL